MGGVRGAFWIDAQMVGDVLTGTDGYGFLKYSATVGGEFTISARTDAGQAEGRLMVIAPSTPAVLFEVEAFAWRTLVRPRDTVARATGRKRPDDNGWGRGTRPVVNVSWEDANAYTAWLSKQTGHRYRLPTEAEWEYAARGGTLEATYNDDLDVTDCSWSDVLNPIGWYCGNSDNTTHPVGELRANAYGLYDVLGNVWEWCHDWYAEYPAGSVEDPWGPSAGSDRVVRGGSWNSLARSTRAAYRVRFSPDSRYANIGFRPSRSLP